MEREPRRWTEAELDEVWRNLRCEKCDGYPNDCCCERTTEDIAMWLEDLATALRAAEGRHE